MGTPKNKTRRNEIIAYSITGLFWLGGLVLCVLGIYAFNASGKLAYNPIFQAQKALAEFLGMSSTIDFRILGSVICLIAMCFFLGFVFHFANKSDRVNSRKARQLARLKELIEEDKRKAQEAEKIEKKVEEPANPNPQNYTNAN